jgi:hypothetical protein
MRGEGKAACVEPRETVRRDGPHIPVRRLDDPGKETTGYVCQPDHQHTRDQRSARVEDALAVAGGAASRERAVAHVRRLGRGRGSGTPITLGPWWSGSAGFGTIAPTAYLDD